MEVRVFSTAPKNMLFQLLSAEFGTLWHNLKALSRSGIRTKSLGYSSWPSEPSVDRRFALSKQPCLDRFGMPPRLTKRPNARGQFFRALRYHSSDGAFLVSQNSSQIAYGEERLQSHVNVTRARCLRRQALMSGSLPMRRKGATSRDI